MSKILVYMYTSYKRINQFSNGYMINPTISVNKVFREQVENFLRATFHQNTTEIIRNMIRKKDTCVIALIIFMGVKQKIQ